MALSRKDFVDYIEGSQELVCYRVKTWNPHPENPAMEFWITVVKS